MEDFRACGPPIQGLEGLRFELLSWVCCDISDDSMGFVVGWVGVVTSVPRTTMPIQHAAEGWLKTSGMMCAATGVDTLCEHAQRYGGDEEEDKDDHFQSDNSIITM